MELISSYGVSHVAQKTPFLDTNHPQRPIIPMIVGENMVKLKPSICGGFPSHSKPLIRDQARLLRCILQAGSGHAIQHLKAEADGASGRRVRGKPMENPTFGGLEDIRKMCFLQMDP